MDEKKLRELAERHPWDLANRQVMEYFARVLAEGGAAVEPPYTQICTLLQAPHRRDPSGLDVALVGVPWDQGVTHRPGARFGPREIRNASSIASGPMHHQSKIVPFDVCRVADVGDVRLSNRYDLAEGLTEMERYYRHLRSLGVAPLSAGGDHSITLPILKALGADQPVGLVHVDAHCDTTGDHDGSKFHHGGPFRNAVLAGALDPERTIQIGIRGRAEPFWDFSYESGMRVVHIEEVHELGVPGVVEEARRVVGDGPTYVSFDVDGLDPAFAPGTGTPEVGGLTPLEAQAIVRGLRGLHLVGGDVVEVAPPYDPTGNTALVGATMLFEILCVLADSLASRRG